MKIVLLRSGTAKNPLEKDNGCAGWRGWKQGRS